MGNCLVTKLKAEVENNELSRLGEILKIHANLSGSELNRELEVLGGPLTVYTTNGVQLTINGVLQPNPFTFEGGSFNVLPNGEYDITIIDPSYSVNSIDIRRQGLTLISASPIKYRSIRFFELPIGSTVPSDLLSMLDIQTDIEEVILATTKYATTLGTLETFYNKKSLTMLNLNNTSYIVDDRVETLYERQSALRTSESTCTFLYGSRVKFNGANFTVRHVVTFDGVGGCVVKDGSNNTLGSYNGSTWTYV